MFKRLLFIVLILAIGYTYRVEIKSWIEKVTDSVEDISFSDLGKIADKLDLKVSAPEPLSVFKSVTRSQLTASGVVRETNEERFINGGLKALTVNPRLTAAAEAKVEDMFARQYFEHESPVGVGPAGLAKNAGYAYILVGENLATGNFEDDADVVTAWMNSPGHRANILNDRYTEIGVGVGKGTFNGRVVWMAVQEFGLPASACPAPSDILDAEIAQYKAALDDSAALLQQKKQELDDHEGSRREYNEKADEYNKLVEQYNQLLAQTKAKIAEYNKQVEAYNTCAKG